MTLGSYPDGCLHARSRSARQPLPRSTPCPRFENVAKQVGVDVYGLAGGAILDDFDNDGRLDLMVSHSGFGTRRGSSTTGATARSRTARTRAGLAGETGGLNMIQADYDNDGHVDVLVLRGGWMGPAGQVPAVAAAEQGGRHVHGRHQGRRAVDASRADADRHLARLRRRRLARPLRGQRNPRRKSRGAEPLRAVPQQPRRDVHQRRRRRRASTSSAS